MSGESIEDFRLTKDATKLLRLIRRRSGKLTRTSFHVDGLLNGRPHPSSFTILADLADASFLRAKSPPKSSNRRHTRVLRTVDLFSGCGGMSLGLKEAARALGYRFRPLLAIDTDEEALKVYKANFPLATTTVLDIRTLLRGRLRARLIAKERDLKKTLQRVDIAVAGPPCQGHSDLNNHTRRRDPQNGLYFRVARFAKLVRPKHLIIENVPAVLHDRGHVVSRTRNALEKLGYNVDDGIVTFLGLGVPQTRRRHVLIASLTRELNLQAAVDQYKRRHRSVRWTIGDLNGLKTSSLIDRPASLTERMRRRIRYLFEHRVYELPNSRRPKCHRENDHTYRSVYGRLRWGQPAQTITSGFTCMGQGRFVHPVARRTLTPHEAARLQLIPDSFSFDDCTVTTSLAEMIGNAVPPKLVYVLALELLR